jgi:hypothetical protein
MDNTLHKTKPFAPVQGTNFFEKLLGSRSRHILSLPYLRSNPSLSCAVVDS